jgi:hypothetical protein
MRVWTWKDVVTAKLNVVFQNASEITEEHRRQRDRQRVMWSELVSEFSSTRR